MPTIHKLKIRIRSFFLLLQNSVKGCLQVSVKHVFSFFACIQDLCSSKHNFFNAVRIEDGIQQHSDSVLVGA